MGAGSPALLLLTDAVDKLPKMREWHDKRIGGNANGNHCCAGDLIGQSIMRRRTLELVYQQNRLSAAVQTCI